MVNPRAANRVVGRIADPRACRSTLHHPRSLRTPSGPAYGPDLPAPAASAEELIAAIGLEPRYAHAAGHLEPLQDFSSSRIDSPQVALVTFPRAVPELSIDPRD